MGSPRSRGASHWDTNSSKRSSMVQDHDYEDNMGLMYRSEEDSPNEYESSSPSEEEARQPAVAPWHSVIVCRYNCPKDCVCHPIKTEEDAPPQAEIAAVRPGTDFWNASLCSENTAAPSCQEERSGNFSHSQETPPPTPPEDEDQFNCLYMLVETAVAVRQQELERELAVRV